MIDPSETGATVRFTGQAIDYWKEENGL